MNKIKVIRVYLYKRASGYQCKHILAAREVNNGKVSDVNEAYYSPRKTGDATLCKRCAAAVTKGAAIEKMLRQAHLPSRLSVPL